jgi:hypothetical protein
MSEINECPIATELDKQIKVEVDAMLKESGLTPEGQVGGGETFCHSICAAIILVSAGVSVGGVYQFYGDLAPFIESALGKGALCTTSVPGVVFEDTIRSLTGQPSCQSVALTYYTNINNLKNSFVFLVGPITLLTIKSNYKQLYDFVAEKTGCDKSTINDGELSCTIPQVAKGGKRKSKKSKGGKKNAKKSVSKSKSHKSKK